MNLADVVHAWDQADRNAIHPSREHDSEVAYWESGQRQAAALAAVLTHGCRVLDFGCGDGRVAVPLHDLGFDVTGADSSPNMLAALPPGIAMVQTDGLDLPRKFGRRKVDAAVCLAVLIHHDYASVAQILAGLVSVVRKGGVLVLDWPVSERPTERRDWCQVTTWSAQARAEVADSLHLEQIDLGLPWATYRKA